MNNDKFSYTYSAPTQEERREIEDIRRAYMPEAEHKDSLARLRALHARAKRPAMIAGLTLGIAGVLAFGLGMSMTLVWEMFAGGIAVAAAGLAAAAAEKKSTARRSSASRTNFWAKKTRTNDVRVFFLRMRDKIYAFAISTSTSPLLQSTESVLLPPVLFSGSELSPFLTLQMIA